MITLKQCTDIEQAIKELEEIIKKTQYHKKELKLNDEVLLSNLKHDLDTFVHYESSKGRDTETKTNNSDKK